jgi:hypothetical protein
MGQEYNVFISWSGERSHGVAQKLREWLPTVVQAAKPWMSDKDIEKGARWFNEVAAALKGIKVGIVCLTPENLHAPWLLFEAGALSKTLDDKTRLCTYLLGGLTPAEVQPPLGMFQHTAAKREETRHLVHAINNAVSDAPVKVEHLDEVFDALWLKLEAAIAAVPPAAPGGAPKRETQDMVEEILELVRAEANARNTNPLISNPTLGSPLINLTRGSPFFGEPPFSALGNLSALKSIIEEATKTAIEEAEKKK